MRSDDRPLPGDLVIRCREDVVTPFNRVVNVWIITHWPEMETVFAGPYQSVNYAFDQARRLVRDPSEFIWLDHARPGAPEELELLSGRDTRPRLQDR